MLHETLTLCRVCGANTLRSILDLGYHPPANSLRKPQDAPPPSIPLHLLCCESCATAQLSETVDPSFLFKHYVWVTGTARTTRDYSRLFCDEILSRAEHRSLFIVEVGSNDGTILEPFKQQGHKVLGIDPAENIVRIANQRGIPTVADFFGVERAKHIVEKHGQADCVIARNVVPHVKNVDDIISGMATCLTDSGYGAIEFHYAKKIVDELQYDSIYHEHLCYYSLGSLAVLLRKHGLTAFDVIESPISGGALVVLCSKNVRPKSPALLKLIKTEDDTRLNTVERWQRFACECSEHMKHLKEQIEDQKARGATIVGYGASARSSTLLNACSINHRHVTCIADQNALKHGMLTPGTDIPIQSPSSVFALNPSVVLLLAWNFQQEILYILKDTYRFKGTVIIPLPRTSRIVEM